MVNIDRDKQAEKQKKILKTNKHKNKKVCKKTEPINGREIKKEKEFHIGIFFFFFFFLRFNICYQFL